ncbi:MAG: VCBS repeat-containing protein [Ignavibacterium sp.]|nr:MAG: VCBS repeat-containing protein [Ignavibacterium sp.]
MKNDDLKRHLKEERTGSITELARFSVIILCLLCSNSAYSQIPINGFCNLNSYPSFTGYTQLTTYDLNNDSYPDILLYSPNSSSIIIAEGKENFEFTDYKIVNVPYYLSNLIPLGEESAYSMDYVFTSRKSRTAGIFNIPLSGDFNPIAEIEFDSFPENIGAADINKDGYSEYLISGSGFNGLSVLFFKDDELTEIKININQSYSEAVFAEVSNDGYPDIIAFNLFSNSIDIFYNDGTGNFELIRQINPGANVESIQSVKIDNDEYIDIVYTAGNSFKILYGDFRSAFDSSLVINTQYNPHKYIIADFNSDSDNDIAYVDTTYGLLSVIFGKEKNQFYDEVLYLKKKGIINLNLLSSYTSAGLALLNYHGAISTISKLSSLVDEMDIVPVLEASVISTFDYGNDGVPDYSYIDNFSNSINFLINSPNGIPSSFYSEIISGEHNSIKVNDVYSFKKTFYAFSPGDKILEAIKFDFKSGEIESHQLYAPGSIEDIEIYKSKKVERIYLAYQRNNYLRFGEYNYKNSEYVLREYATIDSNVVAANIFSSTEPILNYWKTTGDSLQSIEVKITSRGINYTEKGKIVIIPDYSINFLTQFSSNQKNPISFALFNSDTQFFGIVSDESMFNITKPIGYRYDFVSNKSNLLYSEGKKQFVNQNAFLYIWRDGYFNELEINDFGNDLILTRLFDAKQVMDFIVQEFTSENNYLIYSQQSEGFLSLQRLK